MDKLVKIFLRDGSERWMLLHVEVQGNKEKDFARRMFEYFIRIFSKHPDEMLKASMNPFAAVLMVAKEVLLRE